MVEIITQAGKHAAFPTDSRVTSASAPPVYHGRKVQFPPADGRLIDAVELFLPSMGIFGFDMWNFGFR